MRVLVTGGAGLIGYHAAVYYKNKGCQVDVLDNLERCDLLGHTVTPERQYFNIDSLKKHGINWINADVSDKAVFDFLDVRDRYTYILHFAGQCGVPTSIENPRRDMEVNYLGTFNILEFARKTGAAVAFASTNKVYPIHDVFVKNEGKSCWEFANRSWSLTGFPIVNDLEGSRTPYGASKYAADVLCQEYAHTYGVRTGVFRMSCIYGPNQVLSFSEQGWASWFSLATLKDWPLTIYGDGDQVRDMLYVEDCVRAYDYFLSSPLKHGVWNLGGGTGNTLTLNQHLNIMERIEGKRSPVSYENWRPADQKCYVSDILPIKKDLGWEPRVSPEEGLIKVTEFFKKNLEIF